MRNVFIAVTAFVIYCSANATGSDEIVCKTFCEANFERTVESALNPYTANKTYYIRITELNTEIESISANDRQAALASAAEACKKMIEDEVLGYNKKLISLNLFTDKTKSTRADMMNLNCVSTRVVQ